MARTGSALFLLFQIAALCGLFWLCNQIVALTHLPIPASVIGLAILALLLLLRIVPEKAVVAASSWLLGDLLLFFIPPVVSVIKNWVMLREDGGVLVTTLIVGTALVLTGTAWVVDRVFTLEKHLHKRHLRGQADV
ncbi:holin-like protein [Microbulbifer thermotolerans]|uniref:CidA/LrgA family protein n=1 Tax=Microbulbifer thermotolerans TaxID=252514 RepID=UPI0008F01FCD|nr:CidA/LrgA family protein [Microbulbifer thermotolerans]SFB68368.1 holin-like protein [Microbulbifer thermotolerans]